MAEPHREKGAFIDKLEAENKLSLAIISRWLRALQGFTIESNF